MATLNILTGPLRGQTFELDTRGDIFGRGTDRVTLRIPDTAISRRHAGISYADTQWTLHDLNSSNGTFVNDVRIHEPATLHDTDQIRCGATVLLFSNPAEKAETPKSDNTDAIELVFDPGETMVAVAFNEGQSRQAVEQKKRMMEAGQAAMNLSHGIKNILQAVRSGQDVMDEALNYKDIAQARRAWNILTRNLDRVQKLVLDMLKFSKDETPRRQPCHINRLVESVVEMLRPQADPRNIGIIVQCDEHLDQIPVDPDQMQDVIMNLLINAIEAVPPRTGQVVVHTELDSPNRQAVLRVSDNGPGIDDTRMIFEPFHSTKTNVGAGLGLTIARKIIGRHGGTIDVQSLPEEGSIFTVRLPLHAG
jgi:signal transduction histidine kinase